MKILFTKLKKSILNNKIEYYIMPLYQNLMFVKNVSKGFVRILFGSILIKENDTTLKKLPRVLQLPITNKCNLKCKTCNVTNMDNNEDFKLQDLKDAFKDRLFSNIELVGVNGGEPFLKSDLKEYISTILSLPKVKNISLISNGTLSSQILKMLQIIYPMCKDKGVTFNVTFSIDGYDEKHDNIRGVKGSFKKTIETIKTIQDNQYRYCDNLGVICTISKYNIYHLSELETYFKVNKLPTISYQLAIQHKRLENKDFLEEFSILSDKHMKMMAREFFISKYYETRNTRYYFIYKYILDDQSNRMMSCMYKEDAVTIDAYGNVCYCAVESDPIATIKEDEIYERFIDEKNLTYRKSILDNKCNHCIHYSDSKPYIKTFIEAHLFYLNRAKYSYRYLRLGGKMK